MLQYGSEFFEKYQLNILSNGFFIQYCLWLVIIAAKLNNILDSAKFLCKICVFIHIFNDITKYIWYSACLFVSLPAEKALIDGLFEKYRFDVVVNLAAQAGVLPADFDFEAHKKLVPMQPGDVPTTYADSEALQRDYGFTPKISLREGLRKFAEWYKQFYRP